MEVAVEVWRGRRAESRHRVSVCVAEPGGAVLHAVGDVDALVYPRSSLKPFQATLLVESGAADTYGLGDAELALACASHNGEPMHVSRVEGWLGRLGLDSSALACGGHPPLHQPAAADLIRSGRPHSRLHDNCSGKHSGMLTGARHLGLPVEGYHHPDHPLQQRIAEAVADIAGLTSLPEPASDGCSAPIWPIPLRALAVATARLARPSGLSAARAAALQRLGGAMRKEPGMVAGTGRCCTAVMQAFPEITLKTGAEGVYIAALHGPGLGVALKAEDGAGRAAEVALLACIGALIDIPASARPALVGFAAPVVRDRNGAPVGHVAPAPGFPGFARA
jgi:L-asparaginase II